MSVKQRDRRPKIASFAAANIQNITFRGSFHFTTLLSAFQPLFFRVAKQLDLSEVKRDGVLSIFNASWRANRSH